MARARDAQKAATMMSWQTRQAREPEFERRWTHALAEAPLANFTLSLEYLEWEARHGRHAMVVLAEEEGRRGLLVLREDRGGWACGWPWRWGLAMCHGIVLRSPGLAVEDAEWLFDQAEHAVGGGRLRVYVPCAPPPGRACFVCGATIIQAIDRSDEELLASMHRSKRRMVRRARKQGYRVFEGTELDHFRAFAAIQKETLSRRGVHRAYDLPAAPEPGEGWREWELPWMWLLLAERDGRIESGLGDGVLGNAMVEGRAGASTLAGRRAGVFALLCLEEAQRCRERGHRWLNHGGDTPFKREVAGALGVRLPMYCWLGGGSMWAPANHSEAWARSARLRLPKWVRALRAGGLDT